jgi:hypothetical protein
MLKQLVQIATIRLKRVKGSPIMPWNYPKSFVYLGMFSEWADEQDNVTSYWITVLQ